jgi:hypothetical protein
MNDALAPHPNLSGPDRPKRTLGCGAVASIGCGGIVLISVLFGVLSTIGDGSDDDASAGADDSASKYTQTWGKQYSDTTCSDWNGEMTGQQQFAAAADILTSARNKIDDGSGLPSDALVREFEGGITTVCVEPTMTLTDATYGLYATEPRFHP